MSARGILTVVGRALLAFVAICVCLIWAARAHDGYEPECCNNVHCHPIAAPARSGAYWILPDGRRFIAGSTRNSSTIGKTGFHLCEWQPNETPPSNYEPSRIVQPKNKPVCLYVPDAEH